MRYEGYPKVEVPERWNGCLLVNPLCPDDLCWLPLGKGGKQHRLHCLGTDPWDVRFTTGGTAFYMSKIARSARDLYIEGWQKQLHDFPAELEFRRLVWDRDLIDLILNWPAGQEDPPPAA